MKGYGYSLGDPVRVFGFYGEKAYLESLKRIGSEKPLSIERLGSMRSEAAGHPVDVYKIKACSGLFSKTYTVYIDIYGQEDWRAPEGFFLSGPAPAENGDDPEREKMTAMFNAIKAFQEKLKI